jgi:hypothetical protein
VSVARVLNVLLIFTCCFVLRRLLLLAAGPAQVMAREIFNPNLALFVSVPEGGTTFQPNPNSVVQSDTGVSHLEFFKFVGRLVGKALYDGQIMDAYFTRSFYKHMLGQPLTYEVSAARARAGAGVAAYVW